VISDTIRNRMWKEKMNLIPAFEIGLWNTWIFMLLYFLITYVPGYMINREKVKRAFSPPPILKRRRTFILF
jgi:hypothetical protein